MKKFSLGLIYTFYDFEKVWNQNVLSAKKNLWEMEMYAKSVSDSID